MDWKKLAWSAVVSTGLVMGSACGDDDGVTPDPDSGMGTDSGMAMPMPLDCGDCFYVVNSLDFGPDGDGRYPGFDVDGVDSGPDGDLGPAGSCIVPDYTGYDNSAGVDNGLGGLLAAASSALDVGASIEEALADGTIIILVEPMGVTSTEQDTVGLRIYLGETADGMAPMVDGMNRITADQTFNYLPTPDIMVNGRIEGGVITAGPLDLPLNLEVMGNSISLTIEDAQIRLDVDQMTGVTGSTPHFLGGKIDLVSLFDTLGPLLAGVEVPISLLESILPLYLDLDPVTTETVITITPAGPGPDGMMGTDDDVAAVTYTLEPGDCGSVSAGIGLEFTTAVKGTEVSGT
ncbi:MAG: hypothetical protein R3B99_11660 [Polyangiales bacterium]